MTGLGGLVPRRTHLVGLGAVLLAAPPAPIVAHGATPTPRPSPAHVDHFMSYGVKSAKDTPFPPRGPVALPRLGGGPYDLVKVGSLLLPAAKNGEGVHDSATHLLEYRLRPRKGTPKLEPLADVRVLNQCSDVLLELTKPVAALVPTAKSLAGPATAPSSPAVDHFLCFQAKLQRKAPGGVVLPKFPRGVQVEVADQFQSRRYELTGVTRLCVPTAKTGAPVFLKGPDKGKPAPLAPASVQHADEHLLCYRAKLATTEIAQAGCGPATPGAKGTKIPKQPKHARRRGVFVANQLGALRLDTTKEVELCVPSLAVLPGGGGIPLLPGDPRQLVSAVTFDLSQAPAWTDAELTVDESGSRIVRTRLGIFFTDDATVGAANAILTRLGAEIVAMVAGPAYVVVRIPDPDGLEALRALAAEIEADPAVAAVSLDAIPEPAILPAKFPLPTKELAGDERLLYEERLGYIDHLLAARVPAAWNDARHFDRVPLLVVADAFGEGPPGTEIVATYPSPGDFAVGRPDLAADGFPVRHGYQVLGVIAAAFDPEGGPANCFAPDAAPGSATIGCATGIYPGGPPGKGRIPPRVRVVDMRRHSWLPLEVEILLAVRQYVDDDPGTPPVVVNASIGRLDAWASEAAAMAEGLRWRKLVHVSGLEARFLMIAAAGNVLPKPNTRDARTNSSFTAAALLLDEGDRLQNVLVVENRLDSRFPYRPGGVNPDSKRGGHISATGTNVWTVVLPREGQAGWSGTSLAAPQVAGVAAYVWSLAPKLSVAQVRKLLLDNAQPGEPPALDAYATLVGIDALTGDSRVRRALLDVTQSVTVSAEDVSAFFTNFELPADQRRYSRGDLRAARDPSDPPRFDLNADGKFEMASTTVAGNQVSFDETAVPFDADVVCFAAFAGPYEPGGRTDAGRQRCCDFFKQSGRLAFDAKCFDCPARGRTAHPRDAEEEPKPVGIWRLSTPNGLTTHQLFFLEDGSVMTTLATSGLWEKTGTWTSTPHEVDGEIPYYDVRVDPCPAGPQRTRYGFEGTWSPRPLTDCFAVTSCLNGDACPAMQGLLQTSDGITTSMPFAVDSKRVQGVDGWEPLTPPVLHQCHGGCFEPWWRSGLLFCSPQGGHCLETAAPTCGGVCPPESTCVDEGGSCTCQPDATDGRWGMDE